MRRGNPRTLLTALVVVALALVLASPQASAQVDEGDPKPDPCATEQPPTDGSCDGTPHRCEDGSEPVDGTCPHQGEPPELCWNGVEAKEGTCPPKPESPCPDGQDVCGNIRSCPTDTGLPSGGTCEDPVAARPEVAPVNAAPSPDAGGPLFGRPAPPRGSVTAPAAPGSPAPGTPAVGGVRRRQAPALARTGPTTDGLAAGGFGLLAAGAALLVVSRRRRPVP